MKYIIGGGITGLITAFYHTDSILLTENIGGQIANQFDLGPRYLYICPHTKQLLQDLSIPILKKEAKICYLMQENIMVVLPDLLKQVYWEKTRKIKSPYLTSSLSSGKNIIHYYDIDWHHLVKRLVFILKDRILLGKVNAINLAKQEITFQQNKTTLFYYDHLISTIPAPLFIQIARLIPLVKPKFLKKTFVLSNYKNIQNGERVATILEQYDYIYILDHNIPYHRILKKGNAIILEFVGNDIDNYIASPCDKTFVLKIGQIQNSNAINFSAYLPQNVTLSGRYAEWDHSINITNTIQKILDPTFH